MVLGCWFGIMFVLGLDLRVDAGFLVGCGFVLRLGLVLVDATLVVVVTYGWFAPFVSGFGWIAWWVCCWALFCGCLFCYWVCCGGLLGDLFMV